MKSAQGLGVRRWIVRCRYADAQTDSSNLEFVSLPWRPGVQES
jgi:hypothetical protein